MEDHTAKSPSPHSFDSLEFTIAIETDWCFHIFKSSRQRAALTSVSTRKILQPYSHLHSLLSDCHSGSTPNIGRSFLLVNIHLHFVNFGSFPQTFPPSLVFIYCLFFQASRDLPTSRLPFQGRLTSTDINTRPKDRTTTWIFANFS